MSIQQIDALAPIVIFSYGFIVTLGFALLPAELFEKYQSHPFVAQLQSRRTFAVLSLVVGALWSLQNIWF